MANLKDNELFKKKRKEDVYKALEKLADICQVAYKDDSKDDDYVKDNDYLKKELFDSQEMLQIQEDNSKHDNCDWNDYKPGHEDEERICRCMFYYQNDSEKCENCKIIRKWHNTGSIKVINYQKPTSFRAEGVGNIDIVLEYNGLPYAVEVKRPEGNSDPIPFMIAEIMTYTYNSPYHPAIAVFKDGFHHRKIKKLIEDGNKNFLIIKDYIKVFIIEYDKEKADGVVNFCIKALFE